MLTELLQEYRIILASGSPRRRELLKGLDIPFEVIVLPEISEEFPANLQGKEIALYLSEHKSYAYRSLIDPKTIVITADTIVWHKNKVLNKPLNRQEAVNMLAELSDSMHVVYTGVTISGSQSKVSFFAETGVWFNALTQDEINFYVDNYKPYDKAGAYGAQEWIGYVAIKHIEGSYFNVMGLPVHALYCKLSEFVKNENKN